MRIDHSLRTSLRDRCMNSGPVRGLVDGSMSMSSGSRSLMCCSRDAAGAAAQRVTVSWLRTGSFRSSTSGGAVRPLSRLFRLRGATRGVAGAVQHENELPMSRVSVAGTRSDRQMWQHLLRYRQPNHTHTSITGSSPHLLTQDSATHSFTRTSAFNLEYVR
jgi:hypothetical protein